MLIGTSWVPLHKKSLCETQRLDIPTDSEMMRDMKGEGKTVGAGGKKYFTQGKFKPCF